jgi:hypothetical protein
MAVRLSALRAGRPLPPRKIPGTQSFQPHYVPGVDSASNRNEYEESSWGVKSGRRVRLTVFSGAVQFIPFRCNPSYVIWSPGLNLPRWKHFILHQQRAILATWRQILLPYTHVDFPTEFSCALCTKGSCDSVVSIERIETGYGLDDRGIGVRVPIGSRIFSSPCRPDRLWSPPNLLSNGYRGLFSVGKAAGAWSWPLTSS